MAGPCPQKVCLPLTQGKEPALGLPKQRRGLEQVKGEEEVKEAGRGREDEEGGWQCGKQEEGQGEVAPMASEVATHCSLF